MANRCKLFFGDCTVSLSSLETKEGAMYLAYIFLPDERENISLFLLSQSSQVPHATTRVGAS